jgi:hypothetical protein
LASRPSISTFCITLAAIKGSFVLILISMGGPESFRIIIHVCVRVCHFCTLYNASLLLDTERQRLRPSDFYLTKLLNGC